MLLNVTGLIDLMPQQENELRKRGLFQRSNEIVLKSPRN